MTLVPTLMLVSLLGGNPDIETTQESVESAKPKVTYKVYVAEADRDVSLFDSKETLSTRVRVPTALPTTDEFASDEFANEQATGLTATANRPAGLIVMSTVLHREADQKAILETFQQATRLSILSTPRVLVSEGTPWTVADKVLRPFVTGWSNSEPVQDRPHIEVMSEGFTIQGHQFDVDQSLVRVTFEEFTIDSVQTVDLPDSLPLDGVLQRPEGDTIRVTCAEQLNDGDMLVIGIRRETSGVFNEAAGLFKRQIDWRYVMIQKRDLDVAAQ